MLNKVVQFILPSFCFLSVYMYMYTETPSSLGFAPGRGVTQFHYLYCGLHAQAARRPKAKTKLYTCQTLSVCCFLSVSFLQQQLYVGPSQQQKVDLTSKQIVLIVI